MGTFTLAAALTGLALAWPGAALAQDIRCPRLTAALAAAERAPRADPAQLAQYRNAIETQLQEIQRSADYAASLGCGMGGAPAGECAALDANLRGMQRNLAGLQARSRRIAGGEDDRREIERRRLRAAVEQLGCNDTPGRGKPIEVYPSEASATYQGFFGPDELDPAYAVPPSATSELPPATPQAGAADATPQGSGLRTLCVRQCDGFYFPISFSTSAANFERDADVCRRRCPAATVELYAYDAMSQQPDDAVSTSTGAPLKAMPNAFKYRTSFDNACTCGTPQEDASAPAPNQSRATPGAAMQALGAPAAKPGAPAGAPAQKPAAGTSASLPLDAGQTVETTTPDGQKKKVRVVGPTPYPLQ